MGKRKTRGNGEGTIFQRVRNGKKVWVAEYTTVVNNKKTTITRYGKTRAEVKDKLEKIITEKNTNKLVLNNDTIFKDFIKSFIDDEYKLNKLTDSSYKRKLGYYKIIAEHYIGNMEIQKIQECDVKDFLIYLTKYSNSVIGHTYGVLHTAFKRAVRKNILKYDFLDDKIEFAKPTSQRKDKKVRGFTINEQKKFVQCITSSENHFKYKYQFLLSLYTGMRMRRGKCFVFK